MARSCVSQGGDNDFLYAVVRELQASDPRWGLKWIDGVVGKLDQDEIVYALGDGPYEHDPEYPSFRYEETRELVSIDIIGSHCGTDPQVTWQISETSSGSFAGLLHLTPGAAHFPAGSRDLPPPFLFQVVREVHEANPLLVRQSCVEQGGNNEFIKQVVSRLRTISPRWGLNWKRGVEGDLSQDVVAYTYDEGVRPEDSRVQIIDLIRGHCGTNPEIAWGWVANESRGFTLAPLM